MWSNIRTLARTSARRAMLQSVSPRSRSLDVERGQVNAAHSGRGEEEVAALAGGEQVDEAGAAP